MKRQVVHASLVLAVAFALRAEATNESVPVPSCDIPRFYAVAEDIYRGGQPTAAGFESLKQKGIRTIVNLRKENEEQGLVEKLGMKYVHLPISAWDLIPDEVIQTFLRVLSDPASRPVFVHCQRGADRTGAMVGFYRVAAQGWDGPKAYQEARSLGMRWWYRGLKRQLYQFAEKHAFSPQRPR